MRNTPLVSAVVAFATLIVTPLQAAAPAFHKVTKQELPTAIKPLGELVDAVAWSDAAGHNVAAFFLKVDEKKNTSKLQVTLWAGTPGTKGVVMRTIKDGVSDCDGDLGTKFVPEALAVTDLDGDGYGELTFAYRMTCTTDVSPWELKLLMLERRDKFIVRGATRVLVSDVERVGGEHKPDPELSAVPLFLQHAEKVWASIVDQPST